MKQACCKLCCWHSRADAWRNFAATSVRRHPAWLQVTRLKAEQRTVHPRAAAVSAKAGAASADERSVVVHNVHFGATVEVVAAHFAQ